MPKLKLSDIGIIAREAWASYNNYYPNTIIIAASTYNPALLKAQFVHEVKCLWCYDMSDSMEPHEYPNKFDCINCPMKKKELFEYKRNKNSSGSQTPQTNLDYSSFLPIDTFFEGIGINVNENVVDDCKNKLKSKGVYFPHRVHEQTKKTVIDNLYNEGCDWLKKNGD